MVKRVLEHAAVVIDKKLKKVIELFIKTKISKNEQLEGLGDVSCGG